MRIENGPCGPIPTFDRDEVFPSTSLNPPKRPTRKQLRKRIKELEEQLEAISQRTYCQVTFEQRGHGQGAGPTTQSFAIRRGETLQIQLTRMYLAAGKDPLNPAPVWDVVPVQVTIQ